MANLQNLKHFQKGHKKIGGRKKGVPNKSSSDLAKMILAAAASVGSDGKGSGGAVGYLVSVAQKRPRHFFRLVERLLVFELKQELKHPPKDLAQRALLKILDSAALSLEEKKFLAQIWQKATQDW
jgi:hypothetical protein